MAAVVPLEHAKTRLRHPPVADERFSRLEKQVSRVATMLAASIRKKGPGDVVEDDASRGGCHAKKTPGSRAAAAVAVQFPLWIRVGKDHVIISEATGPAER